MRRSDAKTQPKPRKLPSTNSSDWLVWGGMPRHGRPRIAAVCDACRRRKRSAAFERKGRLAAAAADAADGIGHAARSTRRRGAPCAHGAAPGQQQPANNPVLLPLSAALGGLSVPSGVARAPRSAVHPPSAAAAGLSGSRLFSSQAGSGTCPAGAAASSGAAPQGRHEAEIGAGAACERRKQAGKEVRKGPSLAEVGEAFFELRCAWGCSRRVCSSRRGKRPPSGCEGRASCCYRFSCCITPRTIRILPFLLRLHHRIIHSLHEDLSIKCIELRGAQRNLDGSKLFCI
jgi:hypothetical protein